MLDPEYIAYPSFSYGGNGHDGGGIYLDFSISIPYRHFDSGNSIDTPQSTSTTARVYPAAGTVEADLVAAVQAQVKTHAESQWIGITVNAADVQVVIL
jgi:hypothetical protein